MQRANPFLTGKKRPVVVGHRGVQKLHQENTLAGFKRAAELGVPAVELDVRLTRDRKAVVLHDYHLKRLTGLARNVFDLTWDELSKLRIQKQLPVGVDMHGERVIMKYDREERVPLFAEVLAEVPESVAINVELKLDPLGWWHTDIGTVAAQVISDAHAAHRVILTSFDPRKLRAAGRVRPDLALGFCFDDTMLDFAGPVLERVPALNAKLTPPSDGHIRTAARRLLNKILDSHMLGRFLKTHLVGAEHTLIGSKTVERLHQMGVAIGTHTLFPLGSTTAKRIPPAAYSPAEVERLVRLGVDWIESDDPERLLALVEK